MVRSIFILQQRPWSLEAITLGRFVQSTTNPHQEFHDGANELPAVPLVTKLATLNSIGSSGKAWSLKGAITDILVGGLSRGVESNISITSAEARTYQLQNQMAWFKAVSEKAATRRWLENTFNGGEKAFLIVGFLTLADAQTTQEISSEASATGGIKVPLTAALAAGGIILPIDIGDPETEASKSRAQRAKYDFTAPGELVYAVEYRQVIISGFFNKKVDTASLKSNQWVSAWNQGRAEQNDEERVLQVELDQSEITDEIEDEGLEYVFVEADEK